MSIFDKLYPARSMDKIDTAKKQVKGQSFALWTSGGKKASFFDVNDHSTIKNGYNTNPFVYSVVNRLAGLAADIPLKVQKVIDSKKFAKYMSLDFEAKATNKAHQLKAQSVEDMPDHDLQHLLNRPNAEQGYYEFAKSYYIDKLVTGNSFVFGMEPTEGRPPVELWNLPPLGVTINESNNFFNKILEIYFQWGQTSLTIPPDKFMHSKYYNPTGSVYGLSPLSAARLAMQALNDGDEWNVSLIQNGAKPEYILIVPEGTPDDEKDQLKKRWKETQQGPHSVGTEPLVLEENVIKFHSLGYTVKDMDFINSTLTNMRKVYDVYGVSSEVFNDPQNKTQANKREAIRALYVDRVMPEVSSFCDNLQRWLVPKFGNDIVLTPDLSAVEALSEERGKKVEWMSRLPVLVPNILMQELGYEAVDDPAMDIPYIRSGYVPVGMDDDFLALEADLTYTSKGLNVVKR